MRRYMQTLFKVVQYVQGLNYRKCRIACSRIFRGQCYLKLGLEARERRTELMK